MVWVLDYMLDSTCDNSFSGTHDVCIFLYVFYISIEYLKQTNNSRKSVTWESMTWKNDFEMFNNIYVIIAWNPEVIQIKNLLKKMMFIPRFQLH